MTDSVSKTDAMEPLEDAGPGDAEQPVDVPGEEAVEEVTEGAVPVAESTAPDGDGPSAQEPAPEEPTPEQPTPAADSALAGELAALNDRYLRLAAEFTNYRRRVEQERAGVWGRAQGEMVGKLLDVLDDLQRVAGLDLGNATVEAILEGIDLVDRKFERILADAGVEVIDPVGEPFDPQTMEAMMRAPAASEEDEDRVAMVFQKGYSLNGQLLRPARVSVLKLG